MYQDITNLPDGVYELSVLAFQRVGTNEDASKAHDAGTENITAVIYANDLETPFTSPYTYGMKEPSGGDPADYPYEIMVKQFTSLTLCRVWLQPLLKIQRLIP